MTLYKVCIDIYSSVFYFSLGHCRIRQRYQQIKEVSPLLVLSMCDSHSQLTDLKYDQKLVYSLHYLSSVLALVLLRRFTYWLLSIAARSRIGVANMARQRVLAVASATGVVCSSVSETSSIISPTHTSHSILNHSTPISYTALQTRPASASGTHQQIHDGNRQLNTLSQYHQIVDMFYFVNNVIFAGCSVFTCNPVFV